MVAVNKADGPHAEDARKAARELSRALRLLQPVHPRWRPPVLTCSGLTGEGLGEVWDTVREHRKVLEDDGALAERRSGQRVSWMWDRVRDRLMDAFLRHPEVAARIPELEREVRSGETTATLAADGLLSLFTESDAGGAAEPPAEPGAGAAGRSAEPGSGSSGSNGSHIVK